MRKLASVIAASALLLSSTAAFSDDATPPANSSTTTQTTTTKTYTIDKGQLNDGESAEAGAARILGLDPATFVITATIVGAIIVVTVVESNSSNHT